MTKPSPNCSVLGLSLNADPFFCFSDGRERYHIRGRIIPCGTFCSVWWKSNCNAEPTKCRALEAGKGDCTLQARCLLSVRAAGGGRQSEYSLGYSSILYLIQCSCSSSLSLHLPQLQALPFLLHWTELHSLQQISPDRGSD